MQAGIAACLSWMNFISNAGTYTSCSALRAFEWNSRCFITKSTITVDNIKSQTLINQAKAASEK
jgi:hypothetical protein